MDPTVARVRAEAAANRAVKSQSPRFWNGTVKGYNSQTNLASVVLDGDSEPIEAVVAAELQPEAGNRVLVVLSPPAAAFVTGKLTTHTAPILSGEVTGPFEDTKIGTEVIKDIHISPTAAIAQAKVDGLVAALASKVPLSQRDANNGYPGLAASQGTRNGTKFLRDDGTWQTAYTEPTTVVHDNTTETITGTWTFTAAPLVPVPSNAAHPVRNDDTRLTNSRAPTLHATTHAAGGTDPVTLTIAQITSLQAALDAKAPINNPIFTGIIQGGFGATSTSGVLDWDDASNARSGQGPTLLLGTAPNGPGPASYYHPFTFEYSSKNGNGNMTQMAIPYNTTGAAVHFRCRYSGVWTAWAKVPNSGSIVDADIASAANIAQSKINGLVAALTGKQETSQKNAASGYAGLDAASKIAYSQIPVGTTTSTIAAGDDSRFTNARTPTAHATTHNAGGTDPISVTDAIVASGAAIAQSKINGLVAALTGKQETSEKGAPNGYAPLGSGSLVPPANLGTGTPGAGNFLRGDGTWNAPTFAPPGNMATTDTEQTFTAKKIFSVAPEMPAPTLAAHPVRHDDSRNSNARTPTSHATTHNASGTDPISVTDAIVASGANIAQSKINGLTTDLGNKQPLAAPLTAIAASSPTANTIPKFTSPTAVTPVAIGSTGQSLLAAGTPAAARTDLQLTPPATATFGTGAGQVAEGNDTRITGAAQKANNLSDLASPATARANLGAAPTASPSLTGTVTLGTTGAPIVVTAPGESTIRSRNFDSPETTGPYINLPATGPIDVKGRANNQIVTRILGVSGQSVNVMEVAPGNGQSFNINSYGTAVAPGVYSYNPVNGDKDNYGHITAEGGTTDSVKLVIKGQAGQTAPLANFHNGANAVVASLAPDGVLSVTDIKITSHDQVDYGFTNDYALTNGVEVTLPQSSTNLTVDGSGNAIWPYSAKIAVSGGLTISTTSGAGTAYITLIKDNAVIFNAQFNLLTGNQYLPVSTLFDVGTNSGVRMNIRVDGASPVIRGANKSLVSFLPAHRH